MKAFFFSHRACTCLSHVLFRPKIDGRCQFGADCDGFLNLESILPKKKVGVPKYINAYNSGGISTIKPIFKSPKNDYFL